MKHESAVAGIFILLIALTPYSFASSQQCVSSNILNVTKIVYDYVNGGAVNTTVTTENVTCPYGCDASVNGTGRCLESTTSSFSIPAVWILGTVLFAILGFLIQNKDLYMLRTLFFFASAWFLLNTMSVAINIAYLSSFASKGLLKAMATGIKVTNIILFATFALFFLMFLINLVKWVASINKKKSSFKSPFGG